MGVVFNPFDPFGLDFTGSGGAAGPAQRYTQVIDSLSWGSPSGGYYTISIAQATHGKTNYPNVLCFEQDGSQYVKVEAQDVRIDASGNVQISVPSSPDLRFTGLIVIL